VRASPQTGSRVAAALLAVWLAEVLRPPRAGRTWPAAIRPLRWLLWHTWRRYHSYSLHAEVPLDPRGVYIFASHPHGLFPVAQWLTLPLTCSCARAPSAAERAVAATFCMPLRGAMASVLLHVPLVRHVFRWVGNVPASRGVLEALLRGGTSVVLVPGGIAEGFLSSFDEERVVLSERKGFVRLALAAGVPLVPIYCFGNTRCFRVRAPPPAVRKLLRRLRITMELFWGRAFLPLPFRARITVVVGTPLHAARGESVDSLHARYCVALRALFDKHKRCAGPEWADKQLHIL
jgi:hypothetical protein